MKTPPIQNIIAVAISISLAFFQIMPMGFAGRVARPVFTPGAAGDPGVAPTDVPANTDPVKLPAGPIQPGENPALSRPNATENIPPAPPAFKAFQVSASTDSGGATNLTIDVRDSGESTVVYNGKTYTGTYDRGNGRLDLVLFQNAYLTQTLSMEFVFADGRWQLTRMKEHYDKNTSHGWVKETTYVFVQNPLMGPMVQQMTLVGTGCPEGPYQYTNIYTYTYLNIMDVNDPSKNIKVVKASEVVESHFSSDQTEPTSNLSKTYYNYDADGNEIGSVSVERDYSWTVSYDAGYEIRDPANRRIIYGNTSDSDLMDRIRQFSDYSVVDQNARTRRIVYFTDTTLSVQAFTVEEAKQGDVPGYGEFVPRKVETADGKTYIVQGAVDLLSPGDADKDILFKNGQEVNGYKVTYEQGYQYENGKNTQLGYGLVFTKDALVDGVWQSTKVVVDYPKGTSVKLNGKLYEIEIDAAGVLRLVEFRPFTISTTLDPSRFDSDPENISVSVDATGIATVKYALGTFTAAFDPGTRSIVFFQPVSGTEYSQVYTLNFLKVNGAWTLTRFSLKTMRASSENNYEESVYTFVQGPSGGTLVETQAWERVWPGWPVRRNFTVYTYATIPGINKDVLASKVFESHEESSGSAYRAKNYYHYDAAGNLIGNLTAIRSNESGEWVETASLLVDDLQNFREIYSIVRQDGLMDRINQWTDFTVVEQLSQSRQVSYYTSASFAHWKFIIIEVRGTGNGGAGPFVPRQVWMADGKVYIVLGTPDVLSHPPGDEPDVLFDCNQPDVSGYSVRYGSVYTHEGNNYTLVNFGLVFAKDGVETVVDFDPHDAARSEVTLNGASYRILYNAGRGQIGLMRNDVPELGVWLNRYKAMGFKVADAHLITGSTDQWEFLVEDQDFARYPLPLKMRVRYSAPNGWVDPSSVRVDQDLTESRETVQIIYEALRRLNGATESDPLALMYKSLDDFWFRTTFYYRTQGPVDFVLRAVNGGENLEYSAVRDLGGEVVVTALSDKIFPTFSAFYETLRAKYAGLGFLLEYNGASVDVPDQYSFILGDKRDLRNLNTPPYATIFFTTPGEYLDPTSIMVSDTGAADLSNPAQIVYEAVRGLNSWSEPDPLALMYKSLDDYWLKARYYPDGEGGVYFNLGPEETNNTGDYFAYRDADGVVQVEDLSDPASLPDLPSNQPF